MQEELMYDILLKKTDLGNLKCNVDKLDIDKLKNVLTILINLKRKVDVAKLDIDKSVPVPIDLSKLGDVEKMMLLKKMHIMVISKTLKTKYLTLLI